jgi:hypothetical protein
LIKKDISRVEYFCGDDGEDFYKKKLEWRFPDNKEISTFAVALDDNERNPWKFSRNLVRIKPYTICSPSPMDLLFMMKTRS